MTAGVFGAAPDDAGIDPLSVEHVAPFVAYLASPAAGSISGQVFVVHGGMVALLAAPGGRGALRRRRHRICTSGRPTRSTRSSARTSPTATRAGRSPATEVLSLA